MFQMFKNTFDKMFFVKQGIFKFIVAQCCWLDFSVAQKQTENGDFIS